MAVGTLSTRVTSQLQSLQGLHLRLRDIGQYLQKVLKGQLPVNHAILGNLQDVFNLLPNLSTPKIDAAAAAEGGEAARTDNSELARAMSVKINDQLMTIYLSSLIRAITAFHDLIDNKIQNRQQQEEKEAKKEEGKDGGASSSGKKGVNGAAAASGESNGPSGANDEDEAEGGKDKDKDRRERHSSGKDKKHDGKGGGKKR